MEQKVFRTTRILTALTLAALLTMMAAPLSAEDKGSTEAKPTGEAAVAVLSQYIWRGYEMSRHSVVLQPSMTVGYRDFTANVWGNLDTRPYYAGTLSDKSYSSAWNETDVTLSYAKDLGPVTLGGGYIYYGLGALNADAAKRMDAQELFVSLGLNTILAPTLTVYKEIDHYRNWYFLLGLSHTFTLGKAVSLKLSATASYLLSTDETTYPRFDGNALATTEKFNNFHDGNITASLPIMVTDAISLTPTISCVFPLSGDARDEMKGFGLSGAVPSDRNGTFVFGGLVASLRF